MDYETTDNCVKAYYIAGIIFQWNEKEKCFQYEQGISSRSGKLLSVF